MRSCNTTKERIGGEVMTGEDHNGLAVSNVGAKGNIHICQGKTQKQKFSWHVDSAIWRPVQLEECIETKQCPRIRICHFKVMTLHLRECIHI